MASSQVASTYESPTRRIGFRIRRGCSAILFAVRPLAQKSCQLCGFFLSGDIFVTRLFSTVTSIPQEARHYLQNVCTVLVVVAWTPGCGIRAEPVS